MVARTDTMGRMRMKDYWELFSTFFWIGSITFGGGYAVLPILHREIVAQAEMDRRR